MIKCVKEDCDYYNQYGECSHVCIHNGYNKVITNQDRIQSMSVEQLATFLTDISNCEMNDCCFCPLGKTVGACNYKSIKKWLEREVDDE